METCFKILQLKFDQKLTNRCIGLTMKISASTVSPALKPRLCHGPFLKRYPTMALKNSSSRPKAYLHQSGSCRICFTSIPR